MGLNVRTLTAAVSANAAILQTQDATLGRTITTQLENFPVNGRISQVWFCSRPGTSDENKSERRAALRGVGS